MAIATLCVVVFATVASVYWLWVKSPLTLFRGGSVPQPSAAMFVPRNSPAMVSLLVNPDRAAALQRIRTPLKLRGASRAEFDRIKRSVLAETDLNYDRHIKPWLGDEITVAVTRLDAKGDRAKTGYLVALAVKNPAKSQAFLDAFWQERANAGATVIVEDYKGVKLISSQSQRLLFKPRRKVSPSELNPFADSKSEGWASATVGDRFVLFANSVDELRQAINRVQAVDLNLTSSEAYQQAIAHLPKNPLGFALLDLPKLEGWLDKTKSVYTAPQPLAIALLANAKGLRADAIWLSQTHPLATLPRLSHPVDALRYIPQDGALAIAGQDLHQLWQQTTGTAPDPRSTPVAQLLKPLESAWGISLPQDIFSWVTGEYALALFPGDGDKASNWVFVTQQGDRVKEGVQNLDKIASDRGYAVGTFTLDGHEPIYAWTQLKAVVPTANDRVNEWADEEENERQTETQPQLKLEAEVLGVCGSANGYEIFANSVPAIDRALNAPKQGSILKNAEFSTGLNLLMDENQGYLFVDWQASKLTLEQKFPILRFLELAAQPFFEHLQSLTTTSTADPAGFLKTQVFFTLKP